MSIDYILFFLINSATVNTMVMEILFVACIFLFFAFIMKMVKSDNAALYGNTSNDKVITRYFQALDDRNSDQMKKCFIDDYNHDLESDLYNADDARDYDWDIWL